MVIISMSVWTLACFLAWLADESLCLVLPVVNRKSLFGFCYSLESLQSCCRLGLETTLFLFFLSRTAGESCRRTRSDRKDNACLPHSSHTVNLYVLGRTMACASLFDCSGPAARGALPRESSVAGIIPLVKKTRHGSRRDASLSSFFPLF